MVYTVTLNPALDYYLAISEMQQDIQKAEKTSLNYGGKGINVSVILSNLGIDNVALGFLGGFSGKKVEELLDKEKMNTDFVWLEGETRINVKITGAADLTINAQGPSITLKDEQKLLSKLAEIQDGDFVVLAGSVPSSMGEFAYERILDYVGNKKINLVADTTGKKLTGLLKYRPFMIKPNNFELEEIIGERLETQSDIIAAAKSLQKQGARNVLVSLGKDGMLLLDENGDINTEPIIDGKVKNTTGCGDSAVAGFIAGYIRKNNYRSALRLASICGNATAFSNTLASRKDLMKLINMM